MKSEKWICSELELTIKDYQDFLRDDKENPLLHPREMLFTFRSSIVRLAEILDLVVFTWNQDMETLAEKSICEFEEYKLRKSERIE